MEKTLALRTIGNGIDSGYPARRIWLHFSGDE